MRASEILTTAADRTPRFAAQGLALFLGGRVFEQIADASRFRPALTSASHRLRGAITAITASTQQYHDEGRYKQSARPISRFDLHVIHSLALLNQTSQSMTVHTVLLTKQL